MHGCPVRAITEDRQGALMQFAEHHGHHVGDRACAVHIGLPQAVVAQACVRCRVDLGVGPQGVTCSAPGTCVTVSKSTPSWLRSTVNRALSCSEAVAHSHSNKSALRLCVEFEERDRERIALGDGGQGPSRSGCIEQALSRPSVWCLRRRCLRRRHSRR